MKINDYEKKDNEELHDFAFNALAVIVIAFLVLFVCFANKAQAMTEEESNALFAERTARAIAQNQAIIDRQHQRDTLAQEIEVLGRLQELGATRVNVTTEVSNNTFVKQEQNQ